MSEYHVFIMPLQNVTLAIEIMTCKETIELRDVEKYHYLILLASFGSLLCVIAGFAFLWLCRNHHSIRAAGVELSACVLTTTSFRVIHMFLNVWTLSTHLSCAIRFFLPTWATVLMLLTIALKVRIYWKFLLKIQILAFNNSYIYQS